jgi:hypothetical protein
MELEQKQQAMQLRSRRYDGRRSKKTVKKDRNSPEFWNNKLNQLGLGLKRGESRQLWYWGSADQVGDIGSRLELEKDGRRVKPKPTLSQLESNKYS